MDIAFIAPYERMRATAQSIVDAKGYPANVYLGNMETGVEEARKALCNGAKVIISRGWTGRMIREALGIEVIDIKVSLCDILDYIYRYTTPSTRIALAGYNSVIQMAEPVCSILGRQYATFEFDGSVLSSSAVDAIERWKPDIVVGDVVACRLAESRSIKFQLMESTEATMIDAFEHAMLVLNNMQRQVDNAAKLSVVLNCTKEGAILLNSHGEIEEVNLGGCGLLRSTREELLGTPFLDIFNCPELDAALKAGKILKNALISVMGQAFVLDLVITDPLEKGTAAVILFQKVKHVQETESSIRKKLFAKGFYAKYTFEDIIHNSPVMADLIQTARAYSATECNIMIQGETGTGKELFAQSIHNAGPLKNGPFVAINCAALPGALLESELFGYAPGAFTGALSSGKPGLFELAHNGTLFLDEITEMDIFLQSRLLRALQAKEILRLGDDRVIPVNVRIIAASNVVPLAAIEDGKLRADLFYRLNVLDLRIPPLRERGGDASHLFLHYLAVYAKKWGIVISPPPARYLRALDSAPWPGNVRELENLAEKYVVLQHLPASENLLLSNCAPPLAKAEKNTSGDESLDQVIMAYVHASLEREGGNISKAAKSLGISRNTLKRWQAKTGS
jgi:Transcriptional regulator containing PAS, AAA-type ATPase, and DNA-binding domains